MIKDNLKNLRKKITENNLDGYLVPKNDEYFNEYVHPSKDRLNFISNFSGSAGFAIILKNKKYLFVDGRYTIQAQIQSGKNFKIITMPQKFPRNVLKSKKKLKIGFDLKLHNESQLNYFFNIKNIILKPLNKNLIDIIWSKKPKDKIKPFFSLSKKNAGQSSQKKIEKIKKVLLKNKADYLLVTAPENVAWILNIRGHDSAFSPIPNARLLISSKGNIDLFSKIKKIVKIKKNFSKKISFHDENEIEKKLINLKKNNIWLDSLSCSIKFKYLLNENNKIIEKIDPIYLLKSVKNPTEIKNMRKSHIFDGVALTKFLFWLKQNINKKKITELDTKFKLEKFRKENKNYLFPSFNTISSSGPNGAIIHYKATPKSNRLIKKTDIFLCDSGGQYKYGTTDVTRTICFSKPHKRIKDIFTLVLKGHIGVATFKLNKNTTGKKIDKVARHPLKKEGKDYAHGTGHGVGYFLNVHEGLHSISKFGKVKFSEGMVVSNEPGYYEKNKFGIRIENLLFVDKYKKQIKFKNLTMAPIEKELINYDLLNEKEKLYLKEYHEQVYKNISPYLKKVEKEWLRSHIN